MYGQHLTNRRETPQTEKADKRQVKNSAGGYTFAVDDWTRLDRFLVLGSEGGSYYAGERKLTRDNAACVERCLDADGPRTVRRVAEISHSGRAPKNSPAILALALACAHDNVKTRKAAFEHLPGICRTGTHLFEFMATVKQLRGLGRGLRQAIGAWYLNKRPERLAYQLCKYRQRHGWTHRDVLRMARPNDGGGAVGEGTIRAALRWAVKGANGSHAPQPIPAMLEAQSVPVGALPALIREHRLTREMLPTEALNSPAVWEALLEDMPMTAMIRNLGKLSAVKTLAPLSAAARLVCKRLSDTERLRKARVHPLSVLVALRIYQQGHGMRGKLSWSPVSQVVDALDSAFYASFGNVPDVKGGTVLALDVSGSMSFNPIAGMPITPREASAALALVTARTSPEHVIVAFCGNLRVLDISPRARLDDVIRGISRLPFGRTDCSLPMLWAKQNGVVARAFSVYTDNETWAGRIHPHQALRQYRQAYTKDAKLAVVGMAANEFTIADPSDAGMLDVVGFDTATPQLLSDFFS